MMAKAAGLERRQLASRSTAWAGFIARQLSRTPITPNQISLVSLVFAGLGGALLLWGAGWSVYVAAAVCVQARLLCNLLDGMVAVEGGKGTPTGPLFNEVPDRVADCLLLVPLGYVCAAGWLGWLAAVLAIFTAYIRVLGSALGQAQNFGGILPKQRRMAVLTVALIAAAVEAKLTGTKFSLLAGAILIALGSLMTCVSRLSVIARGLEAS
jgi:phosphatidylglycerophosphate synthase